MRRICWALALLPICGPAGAAVWSETAWNTGEVFTGGGHDAAYGAPPCASPFYGTAPGCCECPPSCCDNAWAGYCEEKARCHAFWQRVGSRFSSCGWRTAPADCQPSSATCQPVVQPMPMAPAEITEPEAPSVIPPAPEPAPASTTRKNGVRLQ